MKRKPRRAWAEREARLADQALLGRRLLTELRRLHDEFNREFFGDVIRV